MTRRICFNCGAHCLRTSYCAVCGCPSLLPLDVEATNGVMQQAS